jgi:hypothetical protein
MKPFGFFGISRLSWVSLGLILTVAACGPTDDGMLDPEPSPSLTPTPSPTPVADELAPARRALISVQDSFQALTRQMNAEGPWSQDEEYELRIDLALAKIGRVAAQNPVLAVNAAPSLGVDFWSRLSQDQDQDINAIVLAIMMAATKSAEDDLRQVLDEMKERLQQKKALRDKVTQARDALAELTQALRDSYRKRVDQDAGRSDDQAASTINRFVYIDSDTLVASGAYAAGSVSIQLDCPNAGRNLVSIAIEEVSSGSPIASSVFAAPTVRAQAELPGATPLRFRAKSGLSARQEIYCNVKITGRAASVSGRKAWTAEKRRKAVGLLNDFVQAREAAASAVVTAIRTQDLNDAQASVLLAKLRADFNAGGAAQDLTREDLLELTDTMGDQLNSLSEMDEMASLRLQMYMERRSKVLEALSNILKQFSDTQSAIIANLK